VVPEPPGVLDEGVDVVELPLVEESDLLDVSVAVSFSFLPSVLALPSGCPLFA
jgi:hypothetical protein